MKVLRIILAAAVIISALALVSCADDSDDPGDSLTDTTDTEPEETTDNYEEPGFIVENGVLIKYVGTDADVIIPDEIVKIANDAFADCDFVTSLSIGKDMAEIEDRALFPLTALKSITVPEENTAYIMNGDILEKKDGSVIMSVMNELYENCPRKSDFVIKSDGTMICSDGDISGIISHIYHRVRFANSSIDLNILNRVIIEDVVIEVYIEKDDDNPLYPHPIIKTITAFGHTVEFEEDYRPMYGNFGLDALQTDDFFVLNYTYSINDAFIFTNNNVFYIDAHYNPDGINLNGDEYTYNFIEEDGKLKYERIAHKYMNAAYTGIMQVFGGVFERCVAKDELFKEVGNVTLVNGELVFTPTHTVTVEDFFDLEKEFADWCSHMVDDPDITMEDIFEKNSKLYAKAE